MIKIIAWIVFIDGLLNVFMSLKKTITDQDTAERAVNLIVGIPVGVMIAYLGYYILFVI